MFNFKHIILTLLLISSVLYNSKGQNLIKNPSFEKFVNLNQPSFYGKFWAYNPTYTQIVNDWLTFNSPDHFDSAFIPGGYNVPYSRFGNAYAKHGNAFAGICVFDIRFNYQEYIYQNLSSPLKADSTYCLSFFVSRADRLPLAVKNIGAYFSNNLPTMPLGYIDTVPQIVNTSGFLVDTTNWVEIQGCFTAQGGEQYITIGNFNSNANTDTLRIQSTNPLTGTGTDAAYYYIDSVTLYQNNFPTKVNEFGKDGRFSVWPNPTEGSLTLALSFGEGIEPKQCVIKITDVLGRENFVSEYKEQLNISALEKGIYFITILQGSKTLGVKKIIKQ